MTVDQVLTFEHDVHGRFSAPVSVVDEAARGVSFYSLRPPRLAGGGPSAAITLRELAEDAGDGELDLSDVSSPVALLVILASYSHSRDVAEQLAWEAGVRDHEDASEVPVNASDDGSDG